jgi:hypothetical protein
MATLTFSDALSGQRRRSQLTGRPVSSSETNQIYTNQANTARQNQLGAQSTPQAAPAMQPSSNFADYQKSMQEMMDKFNQYQEEMGRNWEDMLAGLGSYNAPKPYNSENPTANLAQRGQTPTMGGDPTVYKPEIWPGSYTYNPFTNSYDVTYATENFLPGDAGRTVFDPSTGQYIPATGTLRWQKDLGYTVWDDATKSFQGVPSQVFGGSGVPTPPQGPFKSDPGYGGGGEASGVGPGSPTSGNVGMGGVPSGGVAFAKQKYIDDLGNGGMGSTGVA